MSGHAIDRARERYGLELDFRDLEEIRWIISDDPASAIHFEGSIHGPGHYAVRFRDRWMSVVLTDRGDVATFLSSTALRPLINEINARERQRTRLMARPAAPA